jgi:hypothetical protein
MLARGGLWKDAMTQIVAARQASVSVKPPFSNEIVDWNYGIIKLHADAMARDIDGGGYPLLSRVFYGDYAAAVELMRPYPVEQLFRADTPLVKGTVAEAWLPELTGSITTSVASAVALKPDLAPAYFLRGWANYLAGRPAAAVRADLDRATELAPADRLFAAAASLFARPPVTVTPTLTRVPPPTRTPIPTPTPVVSGARRLQFAPGATSAIAEGRLAAGGIDAYVLRAAADQWMMVSVYSPRNDAVLEIYGVADGQPFLRSHMRQTSWRFLLPSTQDYGISVVSTAAATAYTLQVIIPERITFSPGAISATSSGNLAPSQTHDYVLRARAGQTMTLTITSPRGDVLLEAYGLDDGQPLVRVPLGATTWTGKLPGTQDYHIKAVSVGGATRYEIVFTVK